MQLLRSAVSCRVRHPASARHSHAAASAAWERNQSIIAYSLSLTAARHTLAEATARAFMRTSVIAVVGLVLMIGCSASDAKQALKSGSLVDTIVVNAVRLFALPAGSSGKATGVGTDSCLSVSLEVGRQLATRAAAIDSLCASRGRDSRGWLGTTDSGALPARSVGATGNAGQLILGEPSQSLQVAAYDRDGTPVSLLSGTITIRDSTIARLNGLRITALRAGTTPISFRIGEQDARGSVHVYERVKSLDALEQRIRPVAVPLALGAGEAAMAVATRDMDAINVARRRHRPRTSSSRRRRQLCRE